MIADSDRRCGQFAAWTTAVLRGRTSVDAALDVLGADSDNLTVTGIAGSPDSVGLALAIGHLRTLGITGLVAVPAVPGDVSWLPGPPIFNAAAVRAGGAVITADGTAIGLLPHLELRGTPGDYFADLQWHASDVAAFARPMSESPAGAERLLMETIHHALEQLDLLDAARWRDDVSDRLRSAAEARRPLMLPPGISERAARLLERCERLREIATLAETDDGAALSAADASARVAALRPLARAARAAATVAWNSGLLPTGAARGVG